MFKQRWQAHRIHLAWLTGNDFALDADEVRRIEPSSAQVIQTLCGIDNFCGTWGCTVIRGRNVWRKSVGNGKVSNVEVGVYRGRPQWLVDAHADLDAAVAAAYGWPADITEEDALARLLELNLSRSAVAKAKEDAEEQAEQD